MPPVLWETRDEDEDVLHGVEIENKGPVVTEAPPSAPIQAPSVLLTLPGPSTDRLCVDIKESQKPVNLLSDPDQGIEVTGQHTNGGFLWIEVTFKKPEVQVRASPNQVVVTRNRRNSAYKWKETLFLELSGLKITMDKTGLLFSSPDKVTINLGSMDGPRMGLLLLLRDTDRFSSHVNGTIGQFYQGVSWETPDAADDSKRILKVQGKDYSATRELRLDIQEGPPGKEISCWSVDL